MARLRRCPHGTCEWVPVRGSHREVCANCRDVFPCRFACGHMDCIECRITNGRVHPGDYAARNAAVCKWPVKGITVPEEHELLPPDPKSEPQPEEPSAEPQDGV